MTLNIVNKTAAQITYLSGTIVLAANGSISITDTTQQLALAVEGHLYSDLLDANVQLNDGHTTYGAVDAINYLKLIPSVVGPVSDGKGNPITSESYKSTRNLNVIIGDSYQRDAWGRLRVSDTDLIESLTFAQSPHNLLINTSVTGSASAAFHSSTSSMRLTTTTNSSDSVVLQTKRYFRYNPGRSYIVTVSGNLGSPTTNVTQKLGYFDANNGLFFQQTSSGMSVVVRTDSSGSAVDTIIPQSSWNVDKLEGTGNSGVTLDPSKHNLYVIDFLWHGAGRIRFGIIYGSSILYCHEINGANTNTTPYMRRPNLPLRVELVNTGATSSNTTLDLVCFAYQKEASDTLSAPYTFSASRGITQKSVDNHAIYPLLSITPSLTFSGLTNRIPIIPHQIQVAAQQNTIYVAIYLNATLTGASFSNTNSNSAVEVDTSATALSGGTLIKEFYVPANSTLTSAVSADVTAALELVTLDLNIAGTSADVLTIAAESTGGGTNTWAAIEWQEFQ